MQTTTHVLSLILLTVSILSGNLLAQGSLTPPPGAPAPTQKTLQQIWDKIETQENLIRSLQQQNSTLLLQLQSLGAKLPWVLTPTSIKPSSNAPFSLAINTHGQLAIAYWGLDNTLQYAQLNGRQWDVTIVDKATNPGGHCSLAFNAQGFPSIAYHSSSELALKFAQYDGNTWNITTIDQDSDGKESPGEFPSLKFGHDGHPCISYHEATKGELRFACFDGSSWTITLVDGGPPAFGNLGEHSSLAFDPNGFPAISYTDKTNARIKVARYDGRDWVSSKVGDIHAANKTTSLAFDPSGQPSVCYHAPLNLSEVTLQFATYNNVTQRWSAETVAKFGIPEPETELHGYAALAYGFDGNPNIAYYDFLNKNLLYNSSDGDSWDTHTLESTGDTGKFLAIAFGPDGQPVIAYLDSTNTRIKIARRGAFIPRP